MATTSAFTRLVEPPNAIMKVVPVSTAPTENASHVVVDCEEKELAIQACLQGRTSGSTNTNDEEVVDLWHLRQLALLPGGLLCPSLRKSAWPKLTGVSDAILRPYQESNTKITVRLEDVKAMQQDIFYKTIWNVEEQCRRSRLGKEPYWFEPFQAPRPTSTTSKSVSFADLPDVVPSPTSVSTVHSNDHEDEETSICISDSNDEMGRNGAAGTPKPHESYSNKPTAKKQQKTFFLFSPKAPATASAQERSMLHHTMMHALQRAPRDTTAQQQHLRYPTGLSNLAALLWINLESASLTSLLLFQVASFQLNEAFQGQTDATTDNNTMHLLSHLLRQVDHDLYTSLQHLSFDASLLLDSLIDPSNLWFTKSKPNVHVASRLLDVLVASHPLMPIYISAAVLKQHVALSMHEEQSNDERMAMTQLEQAIATALCYMEQLPPAELISAASVRSASAQQSPAWAIAPTAPTDLSLFQKSKEARVLQEENESNEEFHETLQQQLEEPFSDEECSYNSDWESLSLATIDEALNESRFDDNEEALLYSELEAKYRLALIAAGLQVKKQQSPTLSKIKGRSILVATMVLDDDDTANPMFPDLVRQDSVSPVSLESASSDDSSPTLSDIKLNNPVAHRGMPLKMHRKLVGSSQEQQGIVAVAGCWWTWRSVRILVLVVIVVCLWWSRFALHEDAHTANVSSDQTMPATPEAKLSEMIDTPLFEFLTSDTIPEEERQLYEYIFQDVAFDDSDIVVGDDEVVELFEEDHNLDIEWVPNAEEVAAMTKRDEQMEIEWVPNVAEAADDKFEEKLEKLDTLLDDLLLHGASPSVTTLIRSDDRLTILRPFIMQLQRIDRFLRKVLTLFRRRQLVKKYGSAQ